eukprot:2365-Heterococcus_DN1.PRE.3
MQGKRFVATFNIELPAGQTPENWSRHALECKGSRQLALCSNWKLTSEDSAIFLVEHSEAADEGNVYYNRSLGYVGSSLKEFDAIEDLLQPEQCTAANPTLLAAVAAPGTASTGTFIPAAQRQFDTTVVPINASQRAAVQDLPGGLSNIIEARAPASLVSPEPYMHTQNCAVASDAAVAVFGSAERLGTQAVYYTIDGYLHADPELSAWRSARSSWCYTLRRVGSMMQQRD